jgi:hypothetical protein
MMFRVVGRDARGRRRELSICVATAEEAQELARAEGLVTIDRVSVPAPLPPSRLPKLSGFAAGCLACLACVGCVTLGAVIGALVGKESEPPGPRPEERFIQAFFGVPVLRTEWVAGSIVGALVGLACGVGILLACYRHFRERG